MHPEHQCLFDHMHGNCVCFHKYPNVVLMKIDARQLSICYIHAHFCVSSMNTTR